VLVLVVVVGIVGTVVVLEEAHRNGHLAVLALRTTQVQASKLYNVFPAGVAWSVLWSGARCGKQVVLRKRRKARAG
jgi:hypothetical protein